MSAGAPLRFLGLALGGWACLRAAMLVPAWSVEASVAAPRGTQAGGRPVVTAFRPAAAAPTNAGARPRPDSLPTLPNAPKIVAATAAAAPAAMPAEPFAAAPATRARIPALPQQTALPAAAAPARLRRWSASGWVLMRRERGSLALAPGGTLGGSQGGSRLLYRLNGDPARPLAISARLYAPLSDAGAGEAAVGLDWRPLARLPVHLLAERRLPLGRGGRSAFSLAAYGGHSGRIAGGLRADFYAQAGIVGLRSRDLFVDGSVRLAVPMGPVEIGGGAWGAAQPGAERLDVGPQVAFRWPADGVNVRLVADWRFRLAGDAAPDSGPAFTLATDF